MPFITDETIHSFSFDKIERMLQTDPWGTVQKISSADTDTNRMEEVECHSMPLQDNTDGINAFADLCFGHSKTVLDVGGGRSDFNQGYMQKTRGIQLLVWDPFNRSDCHNQDIKKRVQKEPVDAATSMSVLNVISELDARLKHILLMFKALKPGGEAFFKIWSGNAELKRSYLPVAWEKKYQANAHAQRFIFEIQAIFGIQHVMLHPTIPNLIIASRQSENIPGNFELRTILATSKCFHAWIHNVQQIYLDRVNKLHSSRALRFNLFQTSRPIALQMQFDRMAALLCC